MSGTQLTDLHDILFQQLNRLNEESLSDEDLEKEIQRADAISKTSKDIISNAQLCLHAEKLKGESIASLNMPKMLVNKR